MPLTRDRKQVVYVTCLLVGMYALLGARLVQVQVSAADKHRDRQIRATKRSTYRMGRSRFERGRRGTIRDRHGIPLALGGDTFRLYVYCHPKASDERRSEIHSRSLDLLRVLRDLGHEVDGADLLADVNKASGGRFLLGGFAESERRYVTDALDLSRRNEFYFEAEEHRAYPYGRLVGEIVGFVGRAADDDRPEPRGRAGIELVLDTVLAADHGRFDCEKDARQREFDLEDDWVVRPRDGDDVTLTIDVRVQELVDTALRRAVELNPCVSAVGCVIETKTGDVLALRSLPDFDPADVRACKTKTDADVCRGVADSYPPGSTLKPLIVAHALEEDQITLDDIFDVGGGRVRFEVEGRGRVVHDSKPHGVLEMTTREIIERSSNVGMCRIARDRLGKDGIYDAVDRFDLGARSGVLLPADAPGSFTSREKGTLLYSALSMSFGRELGMSPLSVAARFSVLGNGGAFAPPRLVGAVGAGDETTINVRPTRRMLKMSVADTMRDVLVGVVENGTGTILNDLPWTVAAKTGTARILGHPDLDGRYSSSLAAFAPASDPEITVLVVLYGTGGEGRPYYGGSTAGPAVRTVLDGTLRLLGVAPDRSLSEESTEESMEFPMEAPVIDAPSFVPSSDESSAPATSDAEPEEVR